MKIIDVIIIGAGATGLMAAYTLTKEGKNVTVLEARNRIGGRIHTLNNRGFSKPVELGAEFIHGDLPVTLGLLKQAGIKYSRAGFEMWQHHNGILKQSDEFIEGWDLLLKRLDGLKEDMPMHDFLEEFFGGGKHTKMRSQIENFVAGYDTADIYEVSAFALREEWNNHDDDDQYRIEGGYGTLMGYLADACREAGNEICLDSVVKEVIWQNGRVEVVTVANTVYKASKVIVAVPLGVLRANDNMPGAIRFNPGLPEQKQAFNNIGYGAVIKILLEFDSPFWKNVETAQITGGDLSNMGFIFSDEEIPTYWTQAPVQSPLLTGWIGGPPARAKKDVEPEAIMSRALESLGQIFKINAAKLQAGLVNWHVANWTDEPYTYGSYAYEKVNAPRARTILRKPVEGTVYFAGEFLYDGPAIGTVEAALTSGKNTAENLLGK